MRDNLEIVRANADSIGFTPHLSFHLFPPHWSGLFFSFQRRWMLVAQILKISAAYTVPPPEGFISPMTWGVESNVIERFAKAGVPRDKISFVRDTYWFNFPGRSSGLADMFRRFYGPVMNAFEAAEKGGRAGDLKKELDSLFEAQNADSGKGTTSIPATFLRVTVAVD